MNNNQDQNQELIPSTIYISLYLFLLIFFVLLNTNSKYNKAHVKETLHNINNTFSHRKYLLDITAANKINNLNQNLRDVLKEYYKGLIDANIAEDFEKLPIGSDDIDEFEKLSIPLTSIFVENSNKIRDDKKELFVKLSKLLTQNRENNQARVEITLGRIADKDINFESDNEILSDERVLAIHRILQENNVSQKYFICGINKSSLQSVIFTFYIIE